MYKQSFANNPTGVCAALNHWGPWEALKFTTRYILPAVSSVGMEELMAADEPRSHTSCLAASQRIQSSPLLKQSRRWLSWLRPSTAATWTRVLSWLFLSLSTGTIFAKMSRTPRRSA
jgi:hypothetical protein